MLWKRSPDRRAYNEVHVGRLVLDLSQRNGAKRLVQMHNEDVKQLRREIAELKRKAEK